MRVNVLNIGGRRSLAAGMVVSLASAAVPAVLGNGAVQSTIDLLDGVAWLANESDGSVVRVNGETGRVDARVDLGATVAEMFVQQAGDLVLVDLGDEVRSIDVANLDWGASVPATGGLVVGEGAAYMVAPDGLVQQLDPTTLAPLAEVDLGAVPGPGVVVGGRLVVPADDGTVKVVDGDRLAGEVDAGARGDVPRVSRVGDGVAVLNLSQRTLQRLDAGSVDATDPVDIDLPAGELVVPAELPAGPLWLLAVRSGELVGVDIESAEVRTVGVGSPGSNLAGPISVHGRVYLVDRTAGLIIEVDGDSLEVSRREPLAIDSAAKVDVVAEGGKAYVNDRAGALAVVIDGDDYRRVDKYLDEVVPDPGDTAAPDPDPNPAPGPPGTTPAPPPTPATGPPPPPVAVAAVAGNESATVSWRPGPGLFAATRFEVAVPGRPGPVTVPGGQLSTAVAGLTNGETYVLEVTAVNDHGRSGPVASNPVKPNDEVPGTPSDVQAASDASGEATVTWTAADGRGNTIERYIVASAPAGVTTEVAGDATEATVTGLTDGTATTFTVVAVNHLGTQGKPSPASNAVTPYGAPGAIPGPVTKAEGDGTVTLDWNDAPNLSSEQATYRVTVNPGIPQASLPAPGPETSATFNGLQNGVVYSFVITPLNDRGSGPGTTVQATPGRQPTIGGVGVSRTGDRAFDVSFTVDDGGRPITGCTIALSPGGGSVACPAQSGPVTVPVSVDTYATAYTFSVTATNAYGTSSPTSGSGSSNGKPLEVEAGKQRWDGACTWDGHEYQRPRYSTPNHACGTAIGWIDQGTVVRGECWRTGGEIRDDNLVYSDVWIRVDRGGYMSTLYFTTYQDTAATRANLPQC